MRSEQQVAADNALEKAIAECLGAYGFLDGGFMPCDWIVCVELNSFDSEEVGRTRYAHLIPGEGMPYHRLLGLIKVTEKELEREARE